MSSAPNAQSAQTPWVEEFKSRVQAFSEAIGVPYDRVCEVLADKCDVSDQKSDSISILDSEEFLPMTDIFAAFVDNGMAKKPRVRMGVAHLRGKTSLEAPKEVNDNGVAEAIKQLVEQNKPVDAMTLEELLERCDELHPAEVKRLSSITHGRPCIVFNRRNGVVEINKPESLKMIKTAMKQATSNRAMVNGKQVMVYPVGHFWVEPLDESPFFPGVALVNGFCSMSSTDWNGIDQETRTLVRVYVKYIETTKLSPTLMKAIWKEAKKGLSSFREEYQDASLKYDELKDRDELPKMKIHPNQAAPIKQRDTGFIH